MNIIEGCRIHEGGAYRYPIGTPDTEMGKLCKLIAVENCIPEIVAYFLRSGLVIKHPRNETGVWPLYFRFHPRGAKQEVTYGAIQNLIELHCPVDYSNQDTLQYAKHVADAEIDLLIEDDDYFMLLEAKLRKGLHAANFTKTKPPLNLHQLIRQHAEGKLLEKITGKLFIHGTIGAGNFSVLPSAHDQILLSMVGSTLDDIKNIKDCPWSVLE